MLEIVQALIRIPTVSRDSNLALIEYVRSLLERRGWKPVLQYQAAGAKANLTLTIGPADVPGVVLAGHTDVVPVDHQQWLSDPFDPRIHDGRLYGRGACDMKGFIGVVLACILGIEADQLQRPVHLILTYDEEVGCGGAKALMRNADTLFPTRPSYCIVGEPTSMDLLEMHKGMRIFRTRITGTPGHSSIQSGTASAITVAARLIECLANLGDEMTARTPAQNHAFKYPFTTVNVGTFVGGDAVNIVAGHAEFMWEYRYLPDADRAEIFSRFQARAETLLGDFNRGHEERIKIRTEEVSEIPALRAWRCRCDDGLGRILAPRAHTRGADYCAEAGLYQAGLGCSVVLCGPGSIEQAHKADEYVELSQLTQCHEFIIRILDACKQPAVAQHNDSAAFGR